MSAVFFPSFPLTASLKWRYLSQVWSLLDFCVSSTTVKEWKHTEMYCKANSFLSKSVRKLCCCQLSEAEQSALWNIFDGSNRACFASCAWPRFRRFEMVCLHFFLLYLFSFFFFFTTSCFKHQLLICFIILLDRPLSLSYAYGAIGWWAHVSFISCSLQSYEQNSGVVIKNWACLVTTWRSWPGFSDLLCTIKLLCQSLWRVRVITS